MKKLYLSLLAFAAVWQLSAQSLTTPPSGDNQRASVIQWIGPVEVRINYNSPDVHAPNGDDRTGHVWGELVPYGLVDQGYGTAKAAPWRAGANENTTISFSHPVKIGGKDLPAGTYGLFLRVEKDGPWTWIFSKNSTSWGSYFYNTAEDAAQVSANATDAPYTEYLSYTFEERLPNAATAVLQWEKKKVGFKIEVPNVNEVYASIMRNELRSSPGFDPENYATAASFCANHRVNLEEALVWAERSMDPAYSGAETFSRLSVKAAVLEALGKGSEAATIMEKAVKSPTASVTDIHYYARTLLAAGKKEKAMELFLYNAKSHPEEKFTTYVGLARGYTAMGNKKEAIKNWEIALKNIPQGQEGNRPAWEAELKKLKDLK